MIEYKEHGPLNPYKAFILTDDVQNLAASKFILGEIDGNEYRLYALCAYDALSCISVSFGHNFCQI